MSLLLQIHHYLRLTGTTATRFGRDVVNDPRFVFDLRNGREPRAAVTARVVAWLESSGGVAR